MLYPVFLGVRSNSFNTHNMIAELLRDISPIMSGRKEADLRNPG